MRQAKCHVEVRATNPTPATAKLLGRFGAWFVPAGDDLVFRSQLRDCGDVNQHLQWLHGMLQHERKLIRRLDAEGAGLSVRIYCDRLPITLAPESLLIAHQMHLPIEVRPVRA